MKLKYIIMSIFTILIGFIINFIPVTFIKIPVIVTIINIIPIYIITRGNPSSGLITYIGLFLLTILVSYEIALIFLFINGLIGLFIGMFSHYTENKYAISLLSGLFLTVGINAICFILQTNMLEINHSVNFILNIIVIYILSVIACLMTLLVCNKIINIKLIYNLIE